MTSQIRSHTDYLIQTYFIFLCSFCEWVSVSTPILRNPTIATGTFGAWGRGAQNCQFSKKVECLAPPIGVMRQRTLSFWLIWIQRRTFSYGSISQNSRSSSFCSMGDQSWKKPRKLHHAVSGRKYSKSTPAHIRTGRRSRHRPPITIEVEEETRVKKLIAHVSAIFLLPVFEKSVIFTDFRAIVHRVSAREDGNTACWKAMVRSRTVDDSVTYWFPWKHPMAKRQGLEFDVLDQTPRKWARRLGPRHSSLLAPLHENTTLSSVANAPGPNFSPLDVSLAVSDMLRSTPTTRSVVKIDEKISLNDGFSTLLMMKLDTGLLFLGGGTIYKRTTTFEPNWTDFRYAWISKLVRYSSLDSPV